VEDCTVHSLICDVAVLADRSVLMVRYEDVAKYDGEAGWFLPDDVLRELEHPTRAAARILKEQLGLEVGDEPRLGLIESFRGNNGTWHLSFHHVAEFASVPEFRPEKGVAAAQWFPLDALPSRSEVAHNGWALSVLKKLMGASARS
jgi:ADP-ribose pyrophosphatase YjhB (NUDIX family)